MTAHDTMMRVVFAGRDRPARWLGIAVIVLLLAGSWVAVWTAGGTTTALPHVFYVPILVAAVPFGLRGSVSAAVAATILAGPLMPLDVVQGVAQPTGNWATRGVFFLVVGLLAGTTVSALRHSFEAGLTSRFSQELEASATLFARHATIDWSARVQRVLDGKGLRMVFQPIYALDGGDLRAVEALARFSDGGPSAPPNVWFAHAAQAGLGVQLELAAIQRAIDLTIHLDVNVGLTVNASPDTVCDPRMLELIERAAPRRLTVEITEHAIIDDYPRLLGRLAELRAAGARIAVDDAGAGFSSLQHVVRLSPDTLKLDITLTQGLRHDPVRRALATALSQFAREANMTLIAEGIEDPADLADWQDLGAHAAQGYLLGRPGDLPVSSRAALLRLSPDQLRRARRVPVEA